MHDFGSRNVSRKTIALIVLPSTDQAINFEESQVRFVSSLVKQESKVGCKYHNLHSNDGSEQKACLCGVFLKLINQRPYSQPFSSLMRNCGVFFKQVKIFNVRLYPVDFTLLCSRGL